MRPSACITVALTIALFLVTSPTMYGHTGAGDDAADAGRESAPEPADDGGGRAAGEYLYHNYSSLVDDLQDLEADYGELCRLFTAQDEYGIPDAQDGYKVWVLRVGREIPADGGGEPDVDPDAPEVLFVGCHHGDEPVSVEAPYYLAEYLLEGAGSDPAVSRLLDATTIYIAPCVNPWGWMNDERRDANNEDPNRDYPYDGGNDDKGAPLTSVAAQAVYELTQRHNFSAGISWHSGAHLLGWAWGCHAHDGESPDDSAFEAVGDVMAFEGGTFGQGTYTTGRINDILGPVHGAWSDFAYAAGWDGDEMEGGTGAVPGAFSLAYVGEICTSKNTREDELGSREGVDDPGGPGDGWVPKTIRTSRALAELCTPWVELEGALGGERAGGGDEAHRAAGLTVREGDTVRVSWSEGGIADVARSAAVLEAVAVPSGVTVPDTLVFGSFSGDYSFGGTGRAADLVVPRLGLAQGESATFSLYAAAAGDAGMLEQTSPVPAREPASVFAAGRGAAVGGASVGLDPWDTSPSWRSAATITVTVEPAPPSANGDNITIQPFDVHYDGVNGTLEAVDILAAFPAAGRPVLPSEGLTAELFVTPYPLTMSDATGGDGGEGDGATQVDVGSVQNPYSPYYDPDEGQVPEALREEHHLWAYGVSRDHAVDAGWLSGLTWTGDSWEARDVAMSGLRPGEYVATVGFFLPEGDGGDDGSYAHTLRDPETFGFTVTTTLDTDEDGIPNWWELTYGLDTGSQGDSTSDDDSDGLANLGEYLNGTDPLRPDTDGDGLSDGTEILDGTDPTDALDPGGGGSDGGDGEGDDGDDGGDGTGDDGGSGTADGEDGGGGDGGDDNDGDDGGGVIDDTGVLIAVAILIASAAAVLAYVERRRKHLLRGRDRERREHDDWKRERKDGRSPAAKGAGARDDEDPPDGPEE